MNEQLSTRFEIDFDEIFDEKVYRVDEDKTEENIVYAINSYFKNEESGLKATLQGDIKVEKVAKNFVYNEEKALIYQAYEYFNENQVIDDKPDENLSTI